MKKLVVATFNVVLLALLSVLLLACDGKEKFTVTFDADNGTTPTVVEVIRVKKSLSQNRSRKIRIYF